MANPFKAIGKGIWKGLKWTGKHAPAALAVASIVRPDVQILGTLQAVIGSLTVRAEENFPTEGSGKEKSAWVTVEALRAMEILTGLNFDSPQGRALIQKLIDIDIAIKNATAEAIAKAVEPLQKQYDETLALVQAYLASVSEPAKDDTAA